jgi:hypothetical protein
MSRRKAACALRHLKEIIYEACEAAHNEREERQPGLPAIHEIKRAECSRRERAEYRQAEHGNRNRTPYEDAAHARRRDFSFLMQAIEKRRAGIIAHTLPLPSFFLPCAIFIQIVRKERRARDSYGEGDDERYEHASSIEDSHTLRISIAYSGEMRTRGVDKLGDVAEAAIAR